jgi:hypothetical protein
MPERLRDTSEIINYQIRTIVYRACSSGKYQDFLST